jgi:hypothetical protein
MHQHPLRNSGDIEAKEATPLFASRIASTEKVLLSQRFASIARSTNLVSLGQNNALLD